MEEMRQELAERKKKAAAKSQPGPGAPGTKEETKPALSSLWRNVAPAEEGRRRENTFFSQYVMSAVLHQREEKKDRRKESLRLLQDKKSFHLPKNTVKLLYTLFFSNLPILSDITDNSLLQDIFPDVKDKDDPLETPQKIILLFLTSLFQAFSIQESFFQISSDKVFQLLQNAMNPREKKGNILPIWRARHALSSTTCATIDFKLPILDWLISKSTHLFPWLDPVLDLWKYLRAFQPLEYKTFENIVNIPLCSQDVQRQWKSWDFLSRKGPILLFQMIQNYLELYETLYNLRLHLYRVPYKKAEDEFLQSLEMGVIPTWSSADTVGDMIGVEKADLAAQSQFESGNPFSWFQDLYDNFQTKIYTVLDLVPLLKRPQEEQELVEKAIETIKIYQSTSGGSAKILQNVVDFNAQAVTMLKIAEVINYNLQEVGLLLESKKAGDPPMVQYGKCSLTRVRGVEALQTLSFSLRILIKGTLEYTGIPQRREGKEKGYLHEKCTRIRGALYRYYRFVTESFPTFSLQLVERFREVKIHLPGTLELEKMAEQWPELLKVTDTLFRDLDEITSYYQITTLPLKYWMNCENILSKFHFYIVFDLILKLTLDFLRIVRDFISVYISYISYRQKRDEQEVTLSLKRALTILFSLLPTYEAIAPAFIHSFNAPRASSNRIYVSTPLFEDFTAALAPYWTTMEELYIYLISNLSATLIDANDIPNTRAAFRTIRAYTTVYKR